MAKPIILSLSERYLPNWGIHEGIRELIQNFLDSQDDSGNQGEIRFVGGSKRGRIFLKNPGAKNLDRSALLFGVTSKEGREDQRGKFGEGMKIGTLALVRKGVEVIIRTQAETWIAKLGASGEFGNERVLMFDVVSNKNQADFVEVEVGPIEAEDWQNVKNSFRLLCPEKNKNVKESSAYGTLLLDPSEKGRVYAKGIFVKHFPGALYGYDFKRIELNRDRSMIDGASLIYEILYIMDSFARQDTKNISLVENMFSEDSWEVSLPYIWRGGHSVKCILEKILETKKDNPGKGLHVTHDYPRAKKAQSFGYTDVCVTKPFYDSVSDLLEGTHTSGEKFREKFGLVTNKQLMDDIEKPLLRIVKTEELSKEQFIALSWATEVLGRVDVGVNRPPIVVEFSDPFLLGLHVKSGSKNDVYISLKSLLTKQLALLVLIHEYAHDYGPDGSLEHVGVIEATWLKVATLLM